MVPYRANAARERRFVVRFGRFGVPNRHFSTLDRFVIHCEFGPLNLA